MATIRPGSAAPQPRAERPDGRSAGPKRQWRTRRTRLFCFAMQRPAGRRKRVAGARCGSAGKAERRSGPDQSRSTRPRGEVPSVSSRGFRSRLAASHSSRALAPDPPKFKTRSDAAIETREPGGYQRPVRSLRRRHRAESSWHKGEGVRSRLPCIRPADVCRAVRDDPMGHADPAASRWSRSR